MSVIADALRQAQRDDSHVGDGDRDRPPARPIERAGLNGSIQYNAAESKVRNVQREKRARVLRSWLALPVAMCAVAAATFGAMLHPQLNPEPIASPLPAALPAPTNPTPVLQPSNDPVPFVKEEPTPARDPVAATPAPLSADGYHLSGIMRTDEGLWAVINGAVVFTGDSVAGAEVIAIDTRGARIRAGGRETRLTLSGSKTGTN